MAAPDGMACPACRTSLAMSERHGIEIDYCPACRGVWLDRGELDKIVERGTAAAAPGRAPVPHAHETRHRDHDDRRHHGKRRKSFLEELFD